MSCKTLIVVCVLALIQSITPQCIRTYNDIAAEGFGPFGPFAAGPFADGLGPYGVPFGDAYGYGPFDAGFGPYAAGPFGEPLGYGPYGDAFLGSPFAGPFGAGLGPAALAASNGGGLFVTSYSPIAPTGISVVSENAYEGSLAISGAIPFLGAVALEGALPTIGAGTVTYGCGNGNVAIVSEEIDPAPFVFDGLAGPMDGIYGPLAVDAIGPCPGPFPYDGAFGPYGYDIAGPAFAGRFGYSGIAGPFY